MTETTFSSSILGSSPNYTAQCLAAKEGGATALEVADAFNQYDPGLTKMDGYGDLATNQWTTGLLIAAAAKAGAVGSTSPLTPAALLQGFYTLHSTNLDGMVPTTTFTPGKAQSNTCWFWASTANGQFTMPYGTTPACAS